MAAKANIQQIIRRIAWVAVGVAIITMLIAAMQKNNKSICKNVVVNIYGNKEALFLNEKDISSLINANAIINKMEVKAIDIKNMEEQLEKNVWLENVELFFDKENNLHIEVMERNPLCRVFRQNGNSFYIDNKYFLLPLSNEYSAKVPVFTGFGNSEVLTAKDSATLEAMYKMAQFISANPFWMAQIQQINITSNNTFELTPTIGNHTILFGDTSNLTAKFTKLYKFYKTVSTKVGFDKYSVLNVQFKNQIIATGKTTFAIDTTKAAAAIQEFIHNSADSTFIQIDTAAVINANAKQQDSVAKQKPTIAAPVKTNNVKPVAPKPTTTPTIRPAIRTTTPKATMPKRPAAVTVGKNKPQRSQQKKQ